MQDLRIPGPAAWTASSERPEARRSTTGPRRRSTTAIARTVAAAPHYGVELVGLGGRS